MKYILILIFLAAFFSSCEKFCTCTNSSNSSYSEIEISPYEECSQYSDIRTGTTCK